MNYTLRWQSVMNIAIQNSNYFTSNRGFIYYSPPLIAAFYNSIRYTKYHSNRVKLLEKFCHSLKMFIVFSQVVVMRWHSWHGFFFQMCNCTPVIQHIKWANNETAKHINETILSILVVNVSHEYLHHIICILPNRNCI